MKKFAFALAVLAFVAFGAANLSNVIASSINTEFVTDVVKADDDTKKAETKSKDKKDGCCSSKEAKSDCSTKEKKSDCSSKAKTSGCCDSKKKGGTL